MGKLLGGILLVAGTTIGAGMLALPVATGLAGFYPSVSLFIAYWLFLTFTAFLMMEVALWMPGKTNLISMARYTLGRPGEILCWVAYLFLLYALLTAYLAGGGVILLDFVDTLTHTLLPAYVGPLLLMLLFSFFVYKGHRPVDLINRWLMVGLVLTYFALVFGLVPHVDHALIQRTNWSALLASSAVVATSFGFQIIIPSLVTYLDRNVAKIRASILIGSLIALAVYLIWEYLALGILPLEGENGLRYGYSQGSNGATLLADYLKSPSIAWTARLFSFFAIVTSFLGVSLSLSDFFADGFKIPHNPSGNLLLYAMTFVPPLAIALIDPSIFIKALEYAGAFGVVILLGFMPILMVWRGRYTLGLHADYRVFGGKIGLGLAIAFAIAALGFEVQNE